jgi:hypothetical protein
MLLDFIDLSTFGMFVGNYVHLGRPIDRVEKNDGHFSTWDPTYQEAKPEAFLEYHLYQAHLRS